MDEKTQKRLLEDFCRENKNKKIKLVCSNGYQLTGKLIDWDLGFLKVSTDAYSGTTGVYQDILIARNSISVFAPYSNSNRK